MKTKYVFLLAALCLNTLFSFAQESVQTILAVVKPDRIYLLVDETPVKDLFVEVRNESGKIILEHTFQTDTENWYFDLPVLDAGKYTVTCQGQVLAVFHRKASAQPKA